MSPKHTPHDAEPKSKQILKAAVRQCMAEGLNFQHACLMVRTSCSRMARWFEEDKRRGIASPIDIRRDARPADPKSKQILKAAVRQCMAEGLNFRQACLMVRTSCSRMARWFEEDKRHGIASPIDIRRDARLAVQASKQSYRDEVALRRAVYCAPRYNGILGFGA